MEVDMVFKILLAAAAMLPVFMGVSQGAVKDMVEYDSDPAHSSIDFSVRHMVISTVKGFFDKFEATIMYDTSDVTKSTVSVLINPESISTNNETRDKHLKSQDFFYVEKYPEITFKSTKIEKTADGLVMTGNLTIRDVTKEVSFPFVINGPITDPWGNLRFGAEASLTINRQDYGVSWNKVLDSGGLTAGNDVKIDIQIEAVHAKE